MSLQNIFTMIKADRYTEDGCGELNKARKEIEDARRTYKPGEISEKTGLQKQGDGSWAPPKNGTGGASKEAKNPEWGEKAIAMTKKEQKTLSGVPTEKLEKMKEVFEKHNSPTLGAVKKELESRAESKPDGMSKKIVPANNEKGYEAVERTPEEEKRMWAKVAERLSDEKLKLAIKNREGHDLKPVEKIKLEAAQEELAKRNPAYQGHLESDNPPNTDITKEDDERFGKAALSGLSGRRTGNDTKTQYKQAIERRDELVGKKKLSEQEVNELKKTNSTIQKLAKEMTDSAPRVLTGDCRIRVRK